MSSQDNDITLRMLNAVHNDATLTQRRIAKDMGIALGLANAYVKRCIKKGFIKINQAPANRYAYYLTPKGFSEKGRLTAEFFAQGFSFFRQTKDQCNELFKACEQEGWSRLVFYGVSDISEIALLCSQDFNIEVSGLVDEGMIDPPLIKYTDKPIVKEIVEINGFHAVLITDMKHPQAVYENLLGVFPTERILVPPILGVSLAINKHEASE